MNRRYVIAGAAVVGVVGLWHMFGQSGSGGSAQGTTAASSGIPQATTPAPAVSAIPTAQLYGSATATGPSQTSGTLSSLSAFGKPRDGFVQIVSNASPSNSNSLSFGRSPTTTAPISLGSGPTTAVSSGATGTPATPAGAQGVPGATGPAGAVGATGAAGVPRVVSTTQSATPAINTDNGDVFVITGLAQAITSMTSGLTGTPVPGQHLHIAITDNATPRAISWGTSFEASTVALPTTTSTSARLDVEFIWNTTTSKWRCTAVA